MALLQIPIESLDIVLTLDPAISEKVTAARTAIVVLGMSPYKKIFVLDTWVGRQRDPAKVIDQVLAMAREWNPRVIGIEMIAYQAALQPYMEREMASLGKFWPIVQLKPDRNTHAVEKKNQRILSMQPFFKSHQVYMLKGMLDLIEEYETFPQSVTVDLLDAMAYGFRLLVPEEDRRKPALEFKLKELAKEDPGAARIWRYEAIKRGELEPWPETVDEIEELLEDSGGQFVGVGDYL